MMPEGWIQLAALDACEKIGRVPTVLRSQYRDHGKIPVVDQGQAFIAGYTDDEGCRYPGPLPVVVFGDHTREWKFVTFPFAVGADGTQLLRPKAEHDRRFVFEALRALPLKNLGYSRHFKLLRELDIMLPPLGEQKKIAAILLSVDEAIEATQAVIDQLQVVKQAMMAELLTRGLPGRHTRFKQTEIGEVPEEWEVVPFADLLPNGTTNGLYKPASFYGAGTPMLDMGDLFRSEFVEVCERRRVRLTESELDRFLLREGDLLFARRSLKVEGSGQCAVVPALADYPVPESSIIRARLDLRRCHPSFFLYFWNGPVGHRLRMNITRQVAVSGISAGDLVQQHVPLPSLAEQQRIAGAIDEVRCRVTSETGSCEGLRVLKTALMSVLLTGEVRVKPEEEAA